MNHPITNTFAAVALFFIGGLATPAAADTFSHIDRLAVQINNRAEQIVRQTKHYRHTPEYVHLLADSQAMCRLASHIHDVTHFEGNLVHLRSDLAELDAQFHHLASVVERIEHNAAYGQGHLHGRTKNMRRLLDRIEEDIHHLQEDVQSLSIRYTRAVAPRPIAVPRPVYVAPSAPACFPPRTFGGHGVNTYRPDSHDHGHHGSQRGGIGFSIGGGSSKITLQF